MTCRFYHRWTVWSDPVVVTVDSGKPAVSERQTTQLRTCRDCNARDFRGLVLGEIVLDDPGRAALARAACSTGFHDWGAWSEPFAVSAVHYSSNASDPLGDDRRSIEGRTTQHRVCAFCNLQEFKGIPLHDVWFDPGTVHQVEKIRAQSGVQLVATASIPSGGAKDDKAPAASAEPKRLK